MSQDYTKPEFKKLLQKLQEEVSSTKYNNEFIFAESQQGNKLGFETYISTRTLKEGKHVLKVNRTTIKKQDTIYRNVATIPFWYFKD